MKTIIQALKHLSLRKKLILSSVLCVLLPLIFSFLMMNRQIQDELVRMAVAQSNDALEVLDIQMTDYFDNLLYLSNYIQFNERLKTILLRNIERTKQGRATPESEALDDLEISRELEAVMNLLVPLHLTIITDHGYAYTNYPSVKEKAALWKDLYDEIMRDPGYGLHWIGVHPNDIEGEKEKSPHLLSIAGAVRLTERHKAFHLISVRETEIRSMLMERAVHQQQEILLIDAEGTVLSHNQHDFVRSPFPWDEEIRKGGAYRVVQYRGKEYVMVTRPFTYGDWSFVSLIPHKAAVGNIQKVMGNTFLTLLIFFLLFLVLLIALVNLLTKPLQTLNRVIEQVKRGNLQVRSGLAGTGDIEQLGRSWDTMMDTVEQMIEKIKQVERSKRKAELEMLQAQINPHFLFNTLNSLRLNISLNGDQASSKIIQSLSLLLRVTFNRKNESEFIPFWKELDIVRHYLQVMNFKSNSRIELEERVEPNTLDCKVPCFFLQPIIENSIIHGFEHKSGTITITSRSEGDGLVIIVADHGKGLSAEALQHLNKEMQTADAITEVKRNPSSFTGIGIGNVFQRMRFIYGSRFRMEIASPPGGGTQVIFFIPEQHEV